MKAMLVAVFAALFIGLLVQCAIQGQKIEMLTAQLSVVQGELAVAKAALQRAEKELSQIKAEHEARTQRENTLAPTQGAGEVARGEGGPSTTLNPRQDVAAQMRKEALSAVGLFMGSGPLSLAEAAKAAQLIGDLARQSAVPGFMDAHPVVNTHLTMLNAGANVVLADLQAGDVAKAEALRGSMLQTLARNASNLEVVINRESETPEAKAEARKLQSLLKTIQSRLSAATAP